MLNKFKPKHRRAIIMFALIMAVNTTCFGEEEKNTKTDEHDARTAEEIPSTIEFRVRSHPKDTFKPSEAISEDFPVAFPVDI